MNKVFNTSDNIFTSDDVKHAFTHAYNLGRSDWKGNVDTAYEEWESEYENNTLMPLTKEEILKEVAVAFGTSVQAIRDQEYGRGEKVSKARLYAAWFLYMYADDSVQDIADYMGYQNHSSIIYAATKITDLLEVSGRTVRAEIKNSINIVKTRLVHRGYKLKYVMRNREKIETTIELI